MNDLEDVVSSLSVRDSNSGLTLIRYNLQKCVLVVGYTVLHTRVDVTVSFKAENETGLTDGDHVIKNASRSTLGSVAHQMNAILYEGLTIDGKGWIEG